jgi:hypothetical protein
MGSRLRTQHIHIMERHGTKDNTKNENIECTDVRLSSFISVALLRFVSLSANEDTRTFFRSFNRTVDTR